MDKGPLAGRANPRARPIAPAPAGAGQIGVEPAKVVQLEAPLSDSTTHKAFVAAIQPSECPERN